MASLLVRGEEAMEFWSEDGERPLTEPRDEGRDEYDGDDRGAPCDNWVAVDWAR